MELGHVEGKFPFLTVAVFAARRHATPQLYRQTGRIQHYNATNDETSNLRSVKNTVTREMTGFS